MLKNSQNNKSFNRSQWYAILASVVVLCVLYFGFSLREPKQEEIDLKRSLNSTPTSEQIIIRDAKNQLNEEQNTHIHTLNLQIKESKNDESRLSTLEKLSGKWYDLGYPEVSAIYAQKIAEERDNAEAWSIAGTTFFVALKNSKNQDIKEFSAQNAIQAFENSASLEPENVQHRVNLGLTYAEFPPKDNPMKGVMILLDLNKSHPDNPSVLKSLGRLGIKTGQYEKAKARLERVVEINPDDKSAWCLLVQIYMQLDMNAEKENAQRNCKK